MKRLIAGISAAIATTVCQAEVVVPTYGGTIAPIAWFAGGNCSYGMYSVGCVNIKQGPFDSLGRDTLIFQVPQPVNALGFQLSVDTSGSDVSVALYRDGTQVGGAGIYYDPPRDPVTGSYNSQSPQTIFTAYTFDEARVTARRMAVLNRPFSMTDVVFGYAVSVVPEPGACALLAAGLGVLLLGTRRRNLAHSATGDKK